MNKQKTRISKQKTLEDGKYGDMRITNCTKPLFNMLHTSVPYSYKVFRDRILIGELKSQKKQESLLDKDCAIFMHGKMVTGAGKILYTKNANGYLIGIEDKSGTYSLLVNTYWKVISAGKCSINTLIKDTILKEVVGDNITFKKQPKHFDTNNLRFLYEEAGNGRYKVLYMQCFEKTANKPRSYFDIVGFNCIVDTETDSVVRNTVYNEIQSLKDLSTCQVWKGLYRCTISGTFNRYSVDKKVILDLNNNAQELQGDDIETAEINKNNPYFNFMLDGKYIACIKDGKSWVAKFNPKTRRLERITPMGMYCQTYSKIDSDTYYLRIYKMDDSTEKVSGKTKDVALVKLKKYNQIGKVRTHSKNRKCFMSESDQITVYQNESEA